MACLSECVRVLSETCIKGQTLRDSLLRCQFYLQGFGRTFFSVVITLFLNKVRVALDQVRLSAHGHTQRRLLQVINNVCKAGNKELCQCPLLPCFCMCVQEWEKINTSCWNWFVVSMVNVYMCRWCLLVCMFVFFCSSAVFYYSPQPVLIYHDCHCPQLSSQPTIDYFISSRYLCEVQTRTNR